VEERKEVIRAQMKERVKVVERKIRSFCEENSEK
jgi:hypothetical protein